MNEKLKFELALEDAGIKFNTEYKFHPKRKWAFDYVILNDGLYIDFETQKISKIAIEIEGGTRSGGRHVRGDGYARDCEKYNAGTISGWRILRYTTEQIKDIGKVISDIRELMK